MKTDAYIYRKEAFSTNSVNESKYCFRKMECLVCCYSMSHLVPVQALQELTTSNRLNSFLVDLGLRQGSPLSLILFIIFMDIISMQRQNFNSAFFTWCVCWLHQVLAFQLAPAWFAADCEGVEIRIRTSKSYTMILSRKRVALCVMVGSQREKFRYLVVLFTIEGRGEWDINRGIWIVFVVMMMMLCHSILIKSWA